MSVSPAANALGEFPEPVPNSGGIPEAIRETVLIAPYNDIETTTAIIERHHDELGAVIIEPMQRILSPKPGFLQALREATTHYQIPLIFDEVVTGFRLGYGGAQEYYGVTPDLVAMGKIVGGGYPLALTAGREDIMSVFDQSAADAGSFVPQVGTLNANPVACAAGLATLTELRKEGTYQRLHATGRRLRDALERLCGEAEIPMQPAGEDPIFGFYFTDQPVTDYRSSLGGDSAMMARFNTLLLEQGVLKGWPDKFYPSLAHTSEDVDRTIEVFASAIEQLKG
jgi:glutamate-1-semialdehyde 2,1-aminomutase